MKALQVLLCPQEISEGSSAPYSETPEGSFARAVLGEIPEAVIVKDLPLCPQEIPKILLHPQATPEGSSALPSRDS